MTKKKHGNTGRRNAAKTNTKNSQLNVRISAETKARYVKQAKQESLKLSAWIQKILDRETSNAKKNIK